MPTQHAETAYRLAALVAFASSFACSTRTLTVFPFPVDHADASDGEDATPAPDLAVQADADAYAPSDPVGLETPPPDLALAAPDLALAAPDLALAAPDLAVAAPDRALAAPDRAAESGAEGPSPDRVHADTTPDVAADAADDTAGSRVLLYDNFDKGYSQFWLKSEPLDGPVTDSTDGTNKIAVLDASQSEYARLRCNADGSHFKDIDVSAAMRFRIDHAPVPPRTLRLVVRQDPSTVNIFYAVTASITTDGSTTRIGILKKVPDGLGSYTECLLATGPTYSPGIPMGEWRTIKISVSGSTKVKLTAFLDGTAVASFTDDCTSPLTATDGTVAPNGGCLADKTGLGIQVEKGIKASVDDVLVTAP